VKIIIIRFQIPAAVKKHTWTVGSNNIIISAAKLKKSNNNVITKTFKILRIWISFGSADGHAASQ